MNYLILKLFLNSVLITVGKTSTMSCRSMAPGIQRMAFGVDITALSLEPLDFTEPDGFAGHLFDFNCSKGMQFLTSFFM